MATAPIHPSVGQGIFGSQSSITNANGTVNSINVLPFTISANQLQGGIGVGQNGFVSIQNVELSKHEDVTKRRQTIAPVALESFDDSGKPIVMILDPESSITGIEVLKISLLVNEHFSNRHTFWTYKYIKNNNLERHFRFEQ
jgi:hypothetical protein